MMPEYNAAMYACSKICLNSLWGKFGQKPEQSSAEHVTSEDRLWALLDDKSVEVRRIRRLNNTTLLINYTRTQSHMDRFPSRMTNAALASATTAMARMKLYSGLAPLGEQVLYCDTDSIFYRRKPHQPKLECGPYLGDWADETEGDYITSFVATGPKSYGYKTAKGKMQVKVKGFALGVPDAAEKLNLDTLREMVSEEELYKVGAVQAHEKLQVVKVKYEHHIHRDGLTHEMKSVEQMKQFRVTFDKRLILPEADGAIDTVPYWYHGCATQAEIGVIFNNGG